jgi:hypothetical protein
VQRASKSRFAVLDLDVALGDGEAHFARLVQLLQIFRRLTMM